MFRTRTTFTNAPALLATVFLLAITCVARADGVTFDARTARSGNWSDPATWENGRTPRAGDFVQVRPGHAVVYDVDAGPALRMVHVGGVLRFSREKNTRLDVGLLKVQPGEACAEDGFVLAVHADAITAERKSPAKPSPSVEALADLPEPERPALEIGTVDDPLPPGITATIRLVYFPGTDKDDLPAIVDCGGRMDLHGAAQPDLAEARARFGAGDTSVSLAEPVTGWRPGDRVILTAAHPLEYQEAKAAGAGTRRKASPGPRSARSPPSTARRSRSTARWSSSTSPPTPAGARWRTSRRNVVIESADPDGVRGHTMYHRHSSGSISYAEFRHLGKQGVLGRYPVHFHLVRDGMRRPAASSGRASGIRRTASSRSTAPTTCWSATASATTASATATSSRTAPSSTTCWTATSRCRRSRASRCPTRC